MLLFRFLKLKTKYKMSPTTGAKKIIAAQRILTGTAISRRLLSVTMAMIRTMSQMRIVIKTIFSRTDSKMFSIQKYE